MKTFCEATKTTLSWWIFPEIPKDICIYHFNKYIAHSHDHPFLKHKSISSLIFHKSSRVNFFTIVKTSNSFQDSNDWFLWGRGIVASTTICNFSSVWQWNKLYNIFWLLFLYKDYSYIPRKNGIISLYQNFTLHQNKHISWKVTNQKHGPWVSINFGSFMPYPTSYTLNHLQMWFKELLNGTEQKQHLQEHIIFGNGVDFVSTTIKTMSNR